MIPVLLVLAGTVSGPLGTCAMDAHSVALQRSGLRLHRTTNFAIHHDATEIWAAELGSQLEAMEVQFYQQLKDLGAERPVGDHSNGPLVWSCVTGQEWRHTRMLSRFRANYDTRLHQVELMWTPAVDPTATAATTDSAAFEPDGITVADADSLMLRRRLSHEIAHQLSFDCGLQKRGVMYPTWLAEGLATNFESPTSEIQFLGPNLPREQRLKELVGQEALLPLRRFVVLTDVQELTRDELVDLYAQAWGLFRFLAKQHPSALAAYMRTLAALPPGRRNRIELHEEVQASFGPLAGLETEWHQWLRGPMQASLARSP